MVVSTKAFCSQKIPNVTATGRWWMIRLSGSLTCLILVTEREREREEREKIARPNLQREKPLVDAQ